MDTIILASAVLPWLFLLACPLVMFWMMRGMGGGACHKEKGASDRDHHGATGADSAEEIRALQERITQLESERNEARHASGAAGRRLAYPARVIPQQTERGF